MFTEQVQTSMEHVTKHKTLKERFQKIAALSLAETLISMTILSIIFLMIMQSFNAILLGSYMIDARTSVRTEGEFVSEFFELYAKNADPRTLVVVGQNTAINMCNGSALRPNTFTVNSVTWQPLGSGETYTFGYEVADIGLNTGRFIFIQKPQAGTAVRSVLTYGDVNVKDIQLSCETASDSLTGQTFTTVSVAFKLDSKLQMNGRPTVQNVQRTITVVVR